MAAERNEDRKVVAIDLDIKSCQCAGFFCKHFKCLKISVLLKSVISHQINWTLFT